MFLYNAGNAPLTCILYGIGNMYLYNAKTLFHTRVIQDVTCEG